MADGNSLLLEEAAEDVDLEEGAEIADVAVVVDGGAAGVHAKGVTVGGSKLLDGRREGIKESYGHSCGEVVRSSDRPLPILCCFLF